MGRKKKSKGQRPHNKISKEYEFVKEYQIEFIESLEGEEFFFDSEITDKKIKLRRANCYTQIGYECANPECSTNGTKYILGINRKDGAVHLDLYGTDGDGDLHMITLDHIQPKSKGGKNHVSNYQPMCRVCNHIKADNWKDE